MKNKTKTKTATKKVTSKYQTLVSPGVYASTTGTYAVRKMVNGTRQYKTFTNKAKAIKFYNSL